jgi:hypothetical protein
MIGPLPDAAGQPGHPFEIFGCLKSDSILAGNQEACATLVAGARNACSVVRRTNRIDPAADVNPLIVLPRGHGAVAVDVLLERKGA